MQQKKYKKKTFCMNYENEGQKNLAIFEVRKISNLSFNKFAIEAVWEKIMRIKRMDDCERFM